MEANLITVLTHNFCTNRYNELLLLKIVNNSIISLSYILHSVVVREEQTAVLWHRNRGLHYLARRCDTGGNADCSRAK